MAFGTNGVGSHVTIDQSGNVGIGANAPAYPLQVRSTQASTLGLTNPGTAAGTLGQLHGSGLAY